MLKVSNLQLESETMTWFVVSLGTALGHRRRRRRGARGGWDGLGWGHLERLYKASTDYTELQKDYTKT